VFDFIKKYGLWFFVIIFLVLSTQFLIKNHQLPKQYQLDVTLLLHNLEKEAFEKSLQRDLVSAEKHFPLLQKWKKERWYFVQHINDTPAVWNSNKIELDFRKNQNIGQLFYQFGDDFYATFVVDSSLSFAFRLANDGVLHSKFVNFYPQLKNYHLDFKQNLNDSNLSFSFNQEILLSGLWYFLGLALSLFLLVLLHMQRKEWKEVWILIATQVIWFFTFVFLKSFFAPEFSSNIHVLHYTYFRYVLFGLLIISVTITLILQFQGYLKNHFVKIFGLLTTWAVAIFFGNWFNEMIQLSDWFLDFEQLNLLESNSILVLGVVSGFLYFVWFLWNQGSFYSSRDNLKYFIWILPILWIFHLIFGTIFSLIFTSFFTIFMISRWFEFSERNSILIRFLTIAIFCGWFIHKSEERREISFVNSWASTLTENRDTLVEQKLLEIELEIVKLFTTPHTYDSTERLTPTITENLIEQLYFSQHLDKYELLLFRFTTDNELLNRENIFSYEDLNNLYLFHSDPTLANYFYRIKDPRLFHGYIIKLENCLLEENVSTTFLMVKPRLSQSENFYPETFENNSNAPIYNPSNYSVGVYYREELVSKTGNVGFPYRTENLKKTMDEISLRQYSHRYFENDNGFQAIISDNRNRDIAFIALLTICLIVSFIFTVIGLILPFMAGKWTWDYLKTQLFDHYYLRSQIVQSIFGVLLVAMILSSFFLIRVTKNNYQNKQEENLHQLVTTLARQMTENETNQGKILDDSLLLQLRINQLSKNHRVDLNIYDLQGKLLSTSENWIYTAEIFSKWMNYFALNNFEQQKITQLILNEEVEGTSYLSAYAHILNNQNKPIAYINIPLFPSKLDINKQISSILVNFINSYFFILMLGIFVAYLISIRITNPIRDLTAKLARTEINAKNELLEYTRNDEIGTLVKQYNLMVEQLQVSIQKLADSEREYAWREMAQQVAHEIKNPLTPMKLSLQYLQRSSKTDAPEVLQQKYLKTSEMLIKQIDALSNMASEFSNFAKLPDLQLEPIDLSKLLQETIDLFRSNGNLQITTQIEENIHIVADKHQLERVINNVIINAIQAIPENRKPKIELTLKSVHKLAEICIKDNGVGIEEKFAKKVFVPNFSTKTSGMGLGLAICKKIIENTEGNISFESEIGVGTTFKITLPKK
jgi:signal transduction histidine kinase